jgi:hypothetical protein
MRAAWHACRNPSAFTVKRTPLARETLRLVLGSTELIANAWDGAW